MTKETIKQKAEEWVKNIKFTFETEVVRRIVKMFAEQAYIAGATHNKHDLQKNPEDLPKENMKQYIVLDSSGDFYMGWYCTHYNKWLDDSCDDGEEIDNIIAWFELPNKE